MPRYAVEDWCPGSDLLRIVDTGSTVPSDVVGYVEPAGDGFWTAWFRSSDASPFAPSQSSPSGRSADFADRDEAVRAVENLPGPVLGSGPDAVTPRT